MPADRVILLVALLAPAGARAIEWDAQAAASWTGGARAVAVVAVDRCDGVDALAAALARGGARVSVIAAEGADPVDDAALLARAGAVEVVAIARCFAAPPSLLVVLRAPGGAFRAAFTVAAGAPLAARPPGADPADEERRAAELLYRQRSLRVQATWTGSPRRHWTEYVPRYAASDRPLAPVDFFHLVDAPERIRALHRGLALFAALFALAAATNLAGIAVAADAFAHPFPDGGYDGDVVGLGAALFAVGLAGMALSTLAWPHPYAAPEVSALADRYNDRLRARLGLPLGFRF